MSRGEWFDLARVVVWVGLTPAAYLLGWLDSVTFVSLLSIWALVETSWSAYRGGDEKTLRRIEEKLDVLGGDRSRPPESL